MLIFTLFFNRLVGVSSGGPPYPLFAYTGLLLWTFFSNAIAMSSNSLVGNQSLVSKVYFPRVFLPIASIGVLLLDLLVGLLLLALLIAYYHWTVEINLLLVPLYISGTALAAAGVGLILSALNVRFRDVKYGVPFVVQMGLFISPVIYPLSYVPERFHFLWALNPMVGLLAGFRESLLGGESTWQLVAISSTVSVLLFVGGLFVFRRVERDFADII
jgi:lipopolysaccharide transport system permease protein